MSKIKGWNKLPETKNAIIWLNGMGKTIVKVMVVTPLSRRGWVEVQLWNRQGINRVMQKKTKYEAYDYAIDWMRKHPRG